FSNDAIREINLISDQIRMMFIEAEEALKNNNTSAAQKMLEHEGQINAMHENLKKSHVEWLNDGMCQLNSGFIFLELIDNLERVGDRLTNIAQSVIGKMEWMPTKLEREKVSS
ncbi:MAG: PhoU domain-containing protein, partial [Candidatus Omnitrophica bacterium]|nr:PhoU domain-containing protein [Candidatus Omnitrophota bacterium]